MLFSKPLFDTYFINYVETRDGCVPYPEHDCNLNCKRNICLDLVELVRGFVIVNPCTH